MLNSDFERFIVEIDDCIGQITETITKATTCHSKLGFTLAKVILIRLRATFEGVLLLLQNKYKIESFVLMRFIQEQIAYCYCVKQEKKHEIINTIDVRKCIGVYKARVDGFGKMYGQLSGYAHFSLDYINDYIENIPKAEASEFSIQIRTRLDYQTDYDDMFWNYLFISFIYMDVMYVMCGEDRGSSENKSQALEKIKTKLYKVAIDADDLTNLTN